MIIILIITLVTKIGFRVSDHLILWFYTIKFLFSFSINVINNSYIETVGCFSKPKGAGYIGFLFKGNIPLNRDMSFSFLEESKLSIQRKIFSSIAFKPINMLC